MRINVDNGDRYGKLTIIKEMPVKRIPSGQTNRSFLCKCDCGNIKEVRFVHLRNKKIISCGCVHGERHGDSKKRLYIIYHGMIARCKEDYFESHLYFKKGIKVCEEWLNSYIVFRKWALNNGYKDNLTIDRIDNSNGYNPYNCRWVTVIENCNNRDVTVYVKYNGNKVSLRLLLMEQNKQDHYAAIYTRIKRGWEHQKAIDTPIRVGNYSRIKRC